MKTTAKVTEQKNDPSMEDILSSIREIISGEEEASYSVDSRSSEPTAQAVPESDQEILDLINMLHEDNSVEVVQPFSKEIIQGGAAKNKTDAESAQEEKVIEQSAEETEAAKKETPAKKRLSATEEQALENIAKTLSEMDQDQQGDKIPSLEGEALDQLHETMDEIEEGIQNNITGDSDSFLSEETLSKAADALDALADFTGSSSAVPLKQVGEKSVETLMKEVLRPLLKDWLDANLPSMVRTIVTEQVEKIVQQKVKQDSTSRKAS
jgi:cell pole-organizing protein PopZ